ncbi:MAG: hypothetical protein Q7S43_01645 [bacterium]|nr:hypothetical protein [bacterium]
MHRDSLEFPGSVEGTVQFDKDVCCALKRGFEENSVLVEQLSKLVGEKNIKIFADILSSTDEMKFVPSDDMKTAYSQVAKRELERIDATDEDDDDLSCSHSIDEHKEALRSVLEKMESPIN